MPLAPRLLVAIGLPDAARSIPDGEVDQYNQRQAGADVLGAAGAGRAFPTFQTLLFGRSERLAVAR